MHVQGPSTSEHGCNHTTCLLRPCLCMLSTPRLTAPCSHTGTNKGSARLIKPLRLPHAVRRVHQAQQHEVRARQFWLLPPPRVKPGLRRGQPAAVQGPGSFQDARNAPAPALAHQLQLAPRQEPLDGAGEVPVQNKWLVRDLFAQWVQLCEAKFMA